MPTTFLCPNCEAKLQSSNPEIEGKRVRCVKCNSTFTVTAGLIVRDTAVRTLTADRPEEPVARSGRAKRPRKPSPLVPNWARNLIALVLLIVLVATTVIILVNKGWIALGD